jgi:NADH-quinone oxidoreductase E subunit
MTQRQKDFPKLAERLQAQCTAAIAQYEDSRSALLPIVHLFQEHEGFVSPEAICATAEMLHLTPAVVESTVSFYTLFFRKPVGKYVLQVCRGLACSLNGAEDIMAYFREQLGIGHLGTTEDGLFSYEEVECLAACDRATCMQVNLEFVYDLTPRLIDEMLAAMRAGTYAVKPLPQTDRPERTWVTRPDADVGTEQRATGATGVPDPNDPGGIGDVTGLIMLDRIVNKQISFTERTNERAVRDARGIDAIVEAERAP